MDDTKNMLRAIINGQSAMKEELVGEIRKVNKKIEDVRSDLSHKIDTLSEQLNAVETNLTRRVDKLGLQLAGLEDDAPTREEIDNLDNRVKKLEQMTSSV